MQTVRMNSRGSARLAARSSSQQRRARSPRLEARLGVARRGEVPGLAIPRRYGAKRSRRRRPDRARQAVLDVAHAAALRLQPPPGREARHGAPEQTLVVQDPVERRVGEHRVHRSVELQLEQVETISSTARLRGARRASSIIEAERVDADHPPPRQALQEQRCHPPAAAARIEHLSSPAQLEPLDDRAGPFDPAASETRS